jgi:hypothetical protein
MNLVVTSHLGSLAYIISSLLNSKPLSKVYFLHSPDLLVVEI